MPGAGRGAVPDGGGDLGGGEPPGGGLAGRGAGLAGVRDEVVVTAEDGGRGGRVVPAGGVPGGVAGVGGVRSGERVAAGTVWTRDGEGRFVSGGAGLLEGGRGGAVGVVVPAGARGVFDGAGGLAHVVLPDGTSYERGLSGAWSGARAGPGEVIVVKTGEREVLTSGDGKVVVELAPENEKVLDNGVVVAYRQVRDGGGRLAEPRVFLPDGPGGWVRAGSPVEPARYEAWLASANQAHEAARTLFDIAARSGPQVPGGRAAGRRG